MTKKTPQMKPPALLKDEGLAYWKRNAPLCLKSGTLTEDTKDGFVMLCLTWDRFVSAAKSEAGDDIRYVCLTKQVANLQKLYGLDPVSKQKLNIKDDRADDEDEYGN